MIRANHEKPQRLNPHQLTIRQHVFPKSSIDRFKDVLGRVEVFEIFRGRKRKAKPDDEAFVAKRAWDQRSESGYMRKIENAFQMLASDILAGNVWEVSGADVLTVNRMWALWRMRAESRSLRTQEVQGNLIVGDSLTLDQEEVLEKKNSLFTRSSGRIPARFLNGISIQRGIDAFCESFTSSRWGIIRALEGEFIVPDFPLYNFVPLSPEICLISAAPDGTISKENVTAINRDAKAASRLYFFARNISKCPGVGSAP